MRKRNRKREKGRERKKRTGKRGVESWGSDGCGLGLMLRAGGGCDRVGVAAWVGLDLALSRVVRPVGVHEFRVTPGDVYVSFGA